MKLTLLQRIQLLPLIPSKGSYEDLVVAEDLRKKVGLTQDEISANEVKSVQGDNGQGMITMKTNPETELEFKELESNLLKQELEKLEKAKTLGAEMLPLYRLFVLKSS